MERFASPLIETFAGASRHRRRAVELPFLRRFADAGNDEPSADEARLRPQGGISWATAGDHL